jgi:hypothetical protein
MIQITDFAEGLLKSQKEDLSRREKVNKLKN